jgi:hypothetical protein
MAFSRSENMEVLSTHVNRCCYVEARVGVLKPGRRLFLGCFIMTGEWAKVL